MLLLLACIDGKEESLPLESEREAVQWAPAFDTSTSGALSGVWGSGADDVWIVGGKPGAAEIYHYDGAAWSPSPAPEGVDLLVWVHGLGPELAYTVGTAGSAARWNGRVWERLDTGTTQDLWGIFCVSSDDIWVVGGEPDVGPPLILHYDGTSFSPVSLDPAENSRDATTLFKVWGIDGKLWIVGQHGLILSYVDGQWKEQAGGPEASEDFVSLWGTSGEHVVAVGGRSNARISTWDGTGWTTTSPSGRGGLNAIHMPSAEEAVIGGVYGYVATLNPTTGEITEDAPLSGGDVHAIWGDGRRSYAVGGYFAEPYGGLAYVREAP